MQTTTTWLALLLAAGSALTVTATWVAYFARVPSGNVPARPIFSIAAQLLGVGLAIAALLQPAPPLAWGGALVAALAAVGLLLAGLFLWLLTQRKTPVGALKVAVGDTLLPFVALTSEGAPFDVAGLRGERVLLKFFRGGW